MDLRKIGEAFAASPANATGPPELPPNILEALIPGYSIASRYASAYFGLDISIFVTLGLVFFAVTRGGKYIYTILESWFRTLFTCSIYIDEGDDLFDMVMAYMATHQEFTKRSRKMAVKTQRGSSADEAYGANADDALDENGLFNFNKWSARTPPRYEPYYGRQFVLHAGRVFWFRRSKRQTQGQTVQVSFNHAAEDDVIQIDCIGRSIDPIKDLLRTIRVWSLTRSQKTTVVRHPTPKDRARYGGAWSKTTSRPSRPMDTVILDATQKAMIINDMNEYLHPASPHWYAMRGIPYRRGYLFHGPPGTGKTSLSFALAGIFGLEIYAISLQEPTLTEGDLLALFNSLPMRCVVLLEDVDAAGLTRDIESDKPSTKKVGRKGGKPETKEVSGPNGVTETKKDEEYTLKDLARELKALNTTPANSNTAITPRFGRGNRGQDAAAAARQPGQGISLSGLLNAIDGVATHEGRVLIMTTNHPEKLDAALIRPGRVDRKVEFKLAMKEQIRELFVRMYAAENEVVSSGKIMSPVMNGHAKKDELEAMSRETLETLAGEFAGYTPDGTFTPAEVQNLLMRFKKHPRAALREVEMLVETTLEEKRKLEEGGDEDDEEAGKEAGRGVK